MNSGLRRVLNSCHHQLLVRLLKQLKGMLEAVSPNWATVTIKFEEFPGEAGGQEETDSANGYHDRETSYDSAPPFNTKPVLVYVNTPQGGDVDLPLDQVLKAIEPQLLVTLITLRYQLGVYSCRLLEIHNRRHKLEIIPGVTNFGFENVCDGFVLQGNAKEFLVAKGYFESPYAVARYSEARVMQELAENDDRIYGELRGQVVDYGYLPERYDYRGEPLTEPKPAIDTSNEFCKTLISLLPDGQSFVQVEYDDE